MKKILLYMMLVLLCFSCEKEEKYVVATVTTTVTDITSNSAVLDGAVSIEKGKDANDINIVERGFYYRQQESTEWSKYNDFDPNSNSFSANYTGLESQTTYEVQAYTIIGANEVRGNIVTFTTEAETAQVRFSKDKAYTYMTYVDVSEATTPYAAQASYDFGTGMGTSPYYEIPAGVHTLWYYSTFLVDGEEEGIMQLYPYTYNFQAGQKYTITVYFDDTTSDFAANITNDTDLRSTTPTSEITIPENSLNIQEGRGRVSVDNK